MELSSALHKLCLLFSHVLMCAFGLRRHIPRKLADGDVSVISCLIERTAKKATITTNWPELRRDTNIKEGDICLLLQTAGKAFHEVSLSLPLPGRRRLLDSTVAATGLPARRPHH
uniref:TF-B3 domain-containing protein n=1 Tax=Triticum urartu TaxID=4572 RepID=A0A8R7P599_TRIUA